MHGWVGGRRGRQARFRAKEQEEGEEEKKKMMKNTQQRHSLLASWLVARSQKDGKLALTALSPHMAQSWAQSFISGMPAQHSAHSTHSRGGGVLSRGPGGGNPRNHKGVQFGQPSRSPPSRHQAARPLHFTHFSASK